MGSLGPSPPGCMHPSHWSRDSLPPSPWPHRRPGRWEPEAKAHGPQPAGPRGFSHSLAPALHAELCGQPLPGAWVPGCPPQREGNSQGSLGFAAGCCLGANPACAIGGSVPGQVIAPSGLDFVMQKLEMVHLCHPPRAVVRMTAVMHSTQQASHKWQLVSTHHPL